MLILLFLGAKEKTYSHWAAVESFFGLQTTEVGKNPLIKFSMRPSETFVTPCMVWVQCWAKESVMAVCLLISCQLPSPSLVVFLGVFFLKNFQWRKPVP